MSDKTADLAGPGISAYEEVDTKKNIHVLE
jgi:hypothetical protein